LRAAWIGTEWVVVGAVVVVPVECARWVWQPERAAALRAHRSTLAHQALQAAAAARAGEDVPGLDGRLAAYVDRETRHLRQSRWACTGVLAGGSAAAWFGTPALVEASPWFVDVGTAAGGVVGLLLLGRRWFQQRGDVRPGLLPAAEQPEVPVGLRITDTDPGALDTVQHALALVKAKARAERVRRGVGGWGWEFHVRTAKALSAAQLDELAHALDVRRGGLLMSPDPGSTQLYRMRTIVEDLIAATVQPAELPHGLRPTHRVPLARRYDDTPLRLPLLRHVLILGQTGSGKSATLREWMRWIVGAGAHVVGIDLMGGADLAAYGQATHAGVFGPDVPRAERLLQFLLALVRDRTDRLTRSGRDAWTPDLGNPWFLAIDEYWDVARHSVLRNLVESIVLSGRKVWVFFVGANNRRSKDVMRSTVLASQIDTVVLMSMSADDETGLPAQWRAQGAKPSSLLPSLEDDPRDAGKAFVLGGADGAQLARFPYTSKEEGRQLAAAPPRVPVMHEGDLDVWHRFDATMVVTPLMNMIRDAIVAVSADRAPARASVGEISAYCEAQGVALPRDRVTARLGELFGEHRPPRRDMNLPDGNPKGYRLADYDQALAAWEAANDPAR
jgi:S-DNA-T family DNA segregation ATPase FtsK/SpoIIIE